MEEIVTVNNNPLRLGNFTSSEIVAITSMGQREMTDEEKENRPKSGKGSRTTLVDDPNIIGESAWSYIEACNHERRMGRSIDSEVTARPLSWGKLTEKIAFDNLPMGYRLISDTSIVHPDFPFWSGSPDVDKEDEDFSNTVGDIKSPLTMNSFCKLVDPLYHGLKGMDAMNAIRFGWKKKVGSEIIDVKKHPDAEKYYWQLVSNAILKNAKYAELIPYCPYKSELDTIRDMASPSFLDPGEMKNYYWIYQSSDDELPWIMDDGFYKNINIIRFEVPLADKIFLKDRARICGKHLIERV